MEQETDELLKHVDSIKANYGNDILDLTAASKYVQRLFTNTHVHRYLAKASRGVFDRHLNNSWLTVTLTSNAGRPGKPESRTPIVAPDTNTIVEGTLSA